MVSACGFYVGIDAVSWLRTAQTQEKAARQNSVEIVRQRLKRQFQVIERRLRWFLGLTERMKLAEEFPDATERMKRCFELEGIAVSDDDVVRAWSDYSDSLCANWLKLPDSDEDLLSILVKHLPSDRARSEISVVTIVPVAGSHGDLWLPLR